MEYAEPDIDYMVALDSVSKYREIEGYKELEKISDETIRNNLISVVESIEKKGFVPDVNCSNFGVNNGVIKFFDFNISDEKSPPKKGNFAESMSEYMPLDWANKVPVIILDNQYKRN